MAITFMHRTNNSSRRSHGSPLLDALEARRLMSTTLHPTGELVISTANQGADQITIVDFDGPAGRAIKVFENASVSSYTLSLVSRIFIYTEGGDDRIVVSNTDSTKPFPKAVIVAGSGSDRITCIGAGAGEIYGDNAFFMDRPTPGDGPDFIEAGGGSDIVYGGGGNDTVTGGDGDDTLRGGTGNDYLDGGLNNDIVSGDVGSDTIFGGNAKDGSDVLNGDGQGSRPTGQIDLDVLDFSRRKNAVKVLPTNTVGSGEVGEGDVTNGDFEIIFGGAGNDTLNGGNGAERIRGFDGDDVIDGRGGADSLSGDNGNDTVYGGFGEDSITGDLGNDVLFGEADRDTVFGDPGNDNLSGGTGVDTVSYYGRGNGVQMYLDGSHTSGDIRAGESDKLAEFESAIGTYGSDMIFGTDGPNTLDGGAGGNDYLYGFGDNDVLRVTGNGTGNLIGGDGNDTLTGNNGRDYLEGGRGNDTLRALGGNDILNGGDGNDSMEGGDGDDILLGAAGIDTLRGQNGNDTLYGNDGLADVVDGGSGSDKYRADGIDQLFNLETRI